MASENSDKRTAPSTPVMDRLKAETRDRHSVLEALPYFKALIDHRLPLEGYVNQLRALSVIHGVLETEISAQGDPRVSAVWDEETRKLPLLISDLAFFEPRGVPDAAAAMEAAQTLAAKIRTTGSETPAALLGYLYVTEGSTLGNRIHHPDVSATFHLNGVDGCRYYLGYGDRVESRWRRFSEAMNRSLDDPSAHGPLVKAAHEAFSGLERLYAALHPLEKRAPSPHVARINPEAGNHPIPEDPREIEAALKASDRAWALFPYCRERFGERGKRFCDSDTCWIATLVSLDEGDLQGQIDWLCRLLAVRGMPSLMMEQTLEFLREELSIRVPEKAAAYDKLGGAARTLREKRFRWLAEETFESLAAGFHRRAGGETADQNTGRLIVSAVADEKAGVEGAVSALRDWMTDPGRFSARWRDAVHETIDRAMEEIV